MPESWPWRHIRSISDMSDHSHSDFERPRVDEHCMHSRQAPGNLAPPPWQVKTSMGGCRGGAMPPALDPDVVRRRIGEHPHWYHRITLAPGIVTPGIHDSQQTLADLDQLGLPGDCSGLRVLDVGVRDGFFAFELERRGAEVTGIDSAPATGTGFPVAAGVLGSSVKYVVQNVYDL